MSRASGMPSFFQPLTDPGLTLQSDETFAVPPNLDTTSFVYWVMFMEVKCKQATRLSKGVPNVIFSTGCMSEFRRI